MILRGPRPEEMGDLEAYGYDPAALAQLVVDVTERERRMKEALLAKAPNDRRPFEVASCAALVHDDGPRMLGQACLELGLPATWAGGFDKARMTAIVDRTPVLDVERALRLRRLKNGDYRIAGNDLYDMAALGVAVAMCDVVVTDKSAASMLRAAGIDKRHDCVIGARPTEVLAGFQRSWLYQSRAGRWRSLRSERARREGHSATRYCGTIGDSAFRRTQRITEL